MLSCTFPPPLQSHTTHLTIMAIQIERIYIDKRERSIHKHILNFFDISGFSVSRGTQNCGRSLKQSKGNFLLVIPPWQSFFRYTGCSYRNPIQVLFIRSSLRACFCKCVKLKGGCVKSRCNGGWIW